MVYAVKAGGLLEPINKAEGSGCASWTSGDDDAGMAYVLTS
jgi:hypothetical protein